MEAEHSQPTGGERSAGQEHPLSEHPPEDHLSQLQQLQQAPSRPPHGSHGRHHHRQPKRSDLERQLLRLQHQSSTSAAVPTWQLAGAPGPSGGNFPTASQSSSSTQGLHAQVIPSQCSQEVQEGAPPRRERKPQKPGKYVCTYCGRPCAKPSVLQKHIRSHTGERPYPCVPCGFSFKTKSNLYKHRKSHAHRIKAGLATSREDYSLGGPEGGALGEDPEEPTEGESTDSEDETGQHAPVSSQEKLTSQKSGSTETPNLEEPQRAEDSQAVKQRLAMRLSERKRVPVASSDDPPSSLGPGSKGSTESGYCSLSGSTELSQVSPPNTNAKTYAEIILGKYGRLGQQQRGPHHQHLQSSSTSSLGQEEKTIPFTVPKTQVIEHITKLITINEAVVDTSEIDSVKPRRSSLSRKSSIDPKSEALGPSSSSAVPMSLSGFSSESLRPKFPNVDLMAGQASTVPLLRSHSMPSSAGQADSATTSRSFRLSHSFDERQAVVAEMRVGHHHRMLKRQPAIEVPLGAEFIPEENSPSVSSSVTPLTSDPSRKQRRGPRLYECEACGTRCKKRESYESHRRSFCTARQPEEPKKGPESSTYREDRPQMMHYKFRAMAMAVRKRRKEESLEEDPPSPGPAAVSFPLSAPTPVPGREDMFERETSLSTSTQVEPDRRSNWKEISVIQHTSSFEKQESMSVESQEKDEKLISVPLPSVEHQLPLPLKTQQQPPPKPHPVSRLVRQHNIQVPEILVTEEPDADMVPVPTTAITSLVKEPEKVEEFQWPQRSQTLAQLPAEKLPPKKKRLRLAEATQSSGESSFESVSLPRSPSQESSISHASSRSASFEDSGKPDSEVAPAGASRGSQGSHMLTVPSAPHQHHHPHREMRRSASEQAPASTQHPAQIVETRSKSFDYGCLSPQCSSTTWRERRKCLLVKHATLGEPDQEDQPAGPSAKPGTPLVCLSYTTHPAPSSGSESSMAHSSSRHSPDSLRKSVQLLQPSLPSLSQSVYPQHTQTPETFPQGQLAQLLPATTGMTDVPSAQIIPRAYLQTAPPPLHAAQLRIADHLGLPLQPFSSLLPLQYPTGAAQALYLPMPSGLTLQVPKEPFRESKESSSSSQTPIPYHHQPHHPRPIIAPCLEQLAPVVSLVVPVRLQTHIPTYASAMYTTLSQILLTTQSHEPVCCSTMVLTSKLEERTLQSPYLTIPTSKSYLPLELELRMGSEEGYGSTSVGGSKRMLSPAGSLELSTEAQRQQKRVKEEEEEEKEDSEGIRRGGDGEKAKDKVAIEAALVHESKEKVVEAKEEEPKEDKGEAAPEEAAPSKEEEEEESIRIRVLGPESHKGPSYHSLHTTTSVSWCYLNYVKPNPSPQRDPQASVYSSWCVSMHNPNLPGLSTKVALALLRSKQKHSLETYTTAMAPEPTAGKLVPANARKPRMTEVRDTPPHTPFEVKETPPPEKEEEKKGKREEEAPSTSKRCEPSRIRIFEGGYKSNEEYVYVRGRGRGKYVCEECGIRCKKPSMLRKHIRTHTDLRPYVCRHCNFAFKTKGNLTKHMKSKAHGKKCQEMGVSGSSLDELEAEEGVGGSEEQAGGSEDQEEHQFSDVEDSEDDDDNEEEEEEEESSSHDEPPSSCSPDTRLSSSGRSDSGQPPQRDTPEEREAGLTQQDYPSPRRPWPSGRAASPGSKRALFSRCRWEASPRAFSPSGEGSPLCRLSPGPRESSPLRCLSPRLDLSSPGRHLSPSPERGLSPIRPLSPLGSLSPGRYVGPRGLASPAPTAACHRAQSSTGRYARDAEGSTEASEGWQEQISYPRERLIPTDASPPSPALRLMPGEFLGHTPPRTVDRTFSHLPLHSQQLTRMPCLMIPIGGIQMVQPRPSAHPRLLRCPSGASPPSPWKRGPSQSPGEAEGARAGILGDRGAQSKEAGTSQSGFCTSKGHAPPKEHVPETGGEEPKDTGTKQYGSLCTQSQTSTLATEAADAQTEESGSEPGRPSHPSPSLQAPPTHRTSPPPESNCPTEVLHGGRVPEPARGGAGGSGVEARVCQSKNNTTGST
uniref:Transcription factor HIVEP3 n=1 Tax=Paramormyrops kingsleyae TaxID=1676925 RepID=A0A3B3QCT5_9TELE|nr:transcription factor HIVEP3 [Paramormyrops kingsleyae]XP_023663433.1 transcription factor HIVEP3 [Paramormyrops kingsleyae]XP_023663434.1 transcription factor HIVEP3 [Paramormyrops kingsleyae]XP_023663435.1 transcription factor HIVEP3 [Paramormyrops kingsleyae]XP_023663436.1 transcription factor HIVEP3 [Paramormyrops kingsleyae]XP_023663437.1 transcription factor HIVEP3 [Paramormyrops kingsleyae]XP_023663438.1 transcription factor HIVEP3 [Paramormyrops kingsleyae]XP_023663439.1 transcript